MKTWNLSSFDELCAPVLSSVDERSSTGIPSRKRARGRANAKRVAFMGAAVLVAAISVSSLQVYVSGSDDSLRFRVDPVIWRVADERPPLHLLFGGKSPLKWDSAKEGEMLELALAAVQSTDDRASRANAIYSSLWESLPEGREGLPALSDLGVKLG